MKVAVYGGSFDPPHVAHRLTAAYVMSVGGFERLLVLPVHEHAFGKKLAPFADRVELCRRCFAGLAGVEVSALESELPAPNYTERTLERLLELHPDYELALVLGSDVLAETSGWHDFARVSALAPPFVVTRAGYERPGLGPALLPDVSSTHVRELLKRRGDAAADRELGFLVPRAVLEALGERGLYR
jgi:nicotinate-nucleotide adenylyltransferase